MSHSELAQAELIQVQKLHLRLLYCAQTVRDFESDREAVLARWQVPARWGRCFRIRAHRVIVPRCTVGGCSQSKIY